MTQALDFAHPNFHRAGALAAIAEHGSLRKASAMTGIPKSTLHAWQQQAAKAGDAEMGAAGNTQPTDTPAPLPDVVDEAGVSVDPDDQAAGAMVETHARLLDRMVGDDLFLRAFHRYANLIANGVHPEYSLEAAQKVHPSFDLTDEAARRIQEMAPDLAVEKFSEGALVSLAEPPSYVHRTVKAYSFQPADTKALADSIYRAKVDAYTQAVNDQLIRLGRPTILSVTDAASLDALRSASDKVAAGIEETWNRDAASHAALSWMQAEADTRRGAARESGAGTRAQRWDALNTDMEQWMAGREDWKAAMWASTEVNAAYIAGTQEFYRQNPGVATQARVTPDFCQCQGCRDLVSLGWMPLNVALTLGLPLHPHCAHGLDYDVSNALSSGAAYGMDLWNATEYAALGSALAPQRQAASSG